MVEIFKRLLENEFYDNLCTSINEYIEENALEWKTNELNDVVLAEVYDLEVMKVYDFNNEDEEVNFKAYIKAEIELTDYFAGEEITENVLRWFSLNCIAILEDVEIKDIIVERIKPYYK